MRRRQLLATGLGLAGLVACGKTPARGQAASAAPSATKGLDAALLQAGLAEAATLPKLNALIVARHGRPLAERVFNGPDLDTPVNVKSASKSVLAALVGAGIARGVLTGPDQPVAPLLASRAPPAADPRFRALTVDHLLSMRAGLASTSGANYGAWASSDDWVRFALEQPFVAEPGGAMIYSTGTSHLLAAVLNRAAGRPLLTLAREWLGYPLAIAVPDWPVDPQGLHLGGNEMRLSPRALLAFGELYRNAGVREGVQVLPAAWIETSWIPRGWSAWSGHGYGYGWWIRRSGGRDVFYAWGFGGQMVFVVPALQLTAVMTSDPSPGDRDDHVVRLHEILDRSIIPAAERGAA